MNRPEPWHIVIPVLARVLVWGALFLVLYLLRSFFLLVFLTFVFAYIQASAVDRLSSKVKSRVLRVVSVASFGLLILVLVGAYLIPTARVEAFNFVEKVPTYLSELDQLVFELANKYPVIAQIFPEAHLEEKHSVGVQILQLLLGFGDETTGQQTLKDTVGGIANFGKSAVAVGSVFLLSLLFSFLIVLDLPSLTNGARSLAESKLRFVYNETAGTIVNFARVLGKALEAQLMIALLNTFLTAIGLLVLGLGDKMAFLSIIVFFCSFIPVAGVFISSTPICLLALQSGGFSLMLFAIALITIVHIVEAYILNPRIYGHHLRMNPVVVLIILTIGGKLFGVWGLVLGVPICNYIFGYAIRDERKEA